MDNYTRTEGGKTKKFQKIIGYTCYVIPCKAGDTPSVDNINFEDLLTCDWNQRSKHPIDHLTNVISSSIATMSYTKTEMQWCNNYVFINEYLKFVIEPALFSYSFTLVLDFSFFTWL